MATGTFKIDAPTLNDTKRTGLLLGTSAEAGDVITLRGPLGAGKTTLTQFIGEGLEVPVGCYITSPTFSLMHEYPGRLPLYHMDLYRLGDEEEVEELGFLEYIYGDGLTVIEWSERLGSLMPAERLAIHLEFNGENSRTITLSVIGQQWADRAGKLQKALTSP